MTHFTASALSLFLIISSASAAGCYPAYSPGSAYRVGTSVSQSITTTTPLVWTSCAVGAGCPTGWTQTGGVATTATHNFACISNDWCSNSGFAPGSVYTDIAWAKEATACSGTAPAVTAAPTTLAPTPPAWSGVGCPNAYVTGGAYVAGSKVTVGTLAYECKAGPASGWCPLAGYTPGTGTAWDQAWTLLGSCNPAIALTPAPTTLAPTSPAWSGVGCPNAYVAGTAYIEGSTVAVGTSVYECKVGAASGWCPLAGYMPGTGTAWDQAWTLKGSCTGTIAPTTLSPTATQPGCPSAWVSGTAYAAGAMVSAGGKSFQCNAHPMSLFCGQPGYKPNTETFGGAYKLAWTTVGTCAGTLAPVTASPTVTPVYTVGGACPAAYAAGAAYSAGSKVTTVTVGGKNVYQCKAFPYSGYCGQAGYEPNGTYGSMGWTLLGVCDPVATDSPTAAPTASPSKAPTASPSKAPTATPTASPTKAPTTAAPTNTPGP